MKDRFEINVIFRKKDESEMTMGEVSFLLREMGNLISSLGYTFGGGGKLTSSKDRLDWEKLI